MSLKEKDTMDEHRVFERKKVKIKVGNLIDEESMFYNPYKKRVTFESIENTKVVSKNYVI